MMEEPTMGLFDRGYDRDHDRRPRSRDLNYDTWRYRAGNRGDNEFGGTAYNSRNYLNTTTRPYSDYDGAYRSARGGYDREMRSVGIGYDEQYKSRAQTDYGDPFNDRQSHTPIRVMRGEARGYDRDWTGGYDRGYSSRSGSARYGRDYSSNPVSYDPGYGGSRRAMNRYDGSFFGNNRGYDRGWF
jgi:hypothetical protein